MEAEPGEMKENKENKENKEIEVVIVMDSTGSMQQWITDACQTVLDAFKTLQQESPSSVFRLACVCYRDFSDEEPFIVVPFTEDILHVQNTLKKVKAFGGGDEAEDVAGALEKVLELDWKENTVKLVLWVADAPAHGNNYHLLNVGDKYPRGDPNGRDPLQQIQTIFSKGIDLTMFRINRSMDKMIELFSSVYQHSDHPQFMLLDVVKQDAYQGKEERSGYIDLSSYESPYAACTSYTSPSTAIFRSATEEAVRKTIYKSSSM